MHVRRINSGQSVGGSHHSRRSPSGESCCFLCRPGLHPRLRPRDQPDHSWALTPGCHRSCSPWSAVSVANRDFPPMWMSLWKRDATKKKKKKPCFFFFSGWRGLGGYMRRVRAYKNKPAEEGQWLYMVLHTWFPPLLLLTSLPLRCTSPPTERGATESRVWQTLSLKLFWQCRCSCAQGSKNGISGWVERQLLTPQIGDFFNLTDLWVLSDFW